MKNVLAIAELVVAVQAHAVANYETNGWDFWVETLDNDEREAILEGAKTVKGAIKKAKAHCQPLADQRSEIVAEGDGEADADEDEAPKKRGSVVPANYKAAYGKAGNCGDDVVKALAAAQDGGFELDAIATLNGIDFDRWSHLNAGMQRMNLGNVLRGMVKREERVEIGKRVFELAEL